MRSTVKENVMEHSHNVSVIAHALAVINNKVFGGSADIARTVLIALYHESGEVITGDLPTPIKYFNAEIKSAYKDLEQYANQKLLNMLPESLRGEYQNYLQPDTGCCEYKLCKGADKLSAYIKCVEEVKGGNNEFAKAKASIQSEIQRLGLKEVLYFYDNYIPAYEKSLDELE